MREHCPILACTAGLVGDRQVRHRGTIGGSCAHGDSASDLPTVCRALDATFVIQGPGGQRTVPAVDFFRGFFETALGPDEMLTAIRVPKTGSAGWSYVKFRRRALAGAGPGDVPAAAAHPAEGTDPPSDTWATADFRRHLARVLAGRAVEEALGR